jgi:hypothetical protein
MDTTYRPSPRYVAGDPHHVLAAVAISNLHDGRERRPRRRRRPKRSAGAQG